MTDETTVANVSADQGKPDAEAAGAPDWDRELDALSEEFRQSRTESVPETKTDPKPEPAKPEQAPDMQRIAELERQLKALGKTIETQQFDAELAKAVKAVKGDLKIPDKYVKDIVYGRVSSDPRASEIFFRRGENPGAWNKVLSTIHQELASDFGRPDTTGDDLESVEAAVRSASTEPPKREKAFDLAKAVEASDTEFNQMVRDFVK